MQKLIILDRDGVINFDSPNYIKTPEEWLPIPGSLEAIAILKQKGFMTAIATNQSGLGRKYFSTSTLNAIHRKLLQMVQEAGGDISHISYCPHLPDDNCSCRKPLPGLIFEIFAKLQISPSQISKDNTPIFVVGDSMRDLAAALAAGCQPILVLTGNGEKTKQQLPEKLTAMLSSLPSDNILSNENIVSKTKEIPIYTDLLQFAQQLAP